MSGEEKEKFRKQIEKEFEAISNNPQFKDFSECIRRLGEISFEDKELLVDQFRWLKLKQYLPAKWISETLAICRKLLNKSANIIEEGMFFIRLYGLLTEFPLCLVPEDETLKKLFSKYNDLERFEEIQNEIRKMITKIENGFSEIETVAIEFFRLQESHVLPNKFQIRDTEDGKRKRIYGRTGEPTFIVVNEVIRHMVSNYPAKWGYDRMKFAISLASRIVNEISRIDELIKERDNLDIAIY